jgi:hypothetical protein
MKRIFGMLVVGVTVLSVALPASALQKQESKDGIEGKVKKVDVDKNTLTMTTAQGKDRTFTITDDTVIVGPLGGKVRNHLKDPRFHEGFPVNVVASGATATEIHLGFAKDAPSEKTDATKTAKSGAPSSKSLKQLEEDDESEIPGKVKSFETTKHILVISLINGKDRSFILAKDVPVHVNGVMSKQGLQDPAIHAGATITIVTDEGGRKVKDVKISAAKGKKGG